MTNPARAMNKRPGVRGVWTRKIIGNRRHTSHVWANMRQRRTEIPLEAITSGSPRRLKIE
jgi:hypothetical protein